jgi:hypothetical protein
MASPRGLLGNALLERNGSPDVDQADEQSRGDGRAAPRPRRRRPPVTEKGRGRHLHIPDAIYRRLELEALRRGWDKSKLATHLLNQALPTDIKIVVGGEQKAAG